MKTVIAMILLTVVIAGNQAPSPAPLSAAQKAHLQGERLDPVTSIRGLPLGVRDELQKLFRADLLEIAEPGAPFQATDVIVNPKLPRRRLVSAACSTDHCIVYYERGGIAHTWQAALFHWTPAATKLESGGVAPNGLRSINEVKSAILSGATRPTMSW